MGGSVQSTGLCGQLDPQATISLAIGPSVAKDMHALMPRDHMVGTQPMAFTAFDRQVSRAFTMLSRFSTTL